MEVDIYDLMSIYVEGTVFGISKHIFDRELCDRNL